MPFSSKPAVTRRLPTSRHAGLPPRAVPRRTFGGKALRKTPFWSDPTAATLTGGVWLDEEPPDATEDAGQGGQASGNGDIYTECLMRTATTDGLLMATFTPMRGLTPFVDHFLDRGNGRGRRAPRQRQRRAVRGEDRVTGSG
jgi:phage terminase large subunit-like protein